MYSVRNPESETMFRNELCWYAVVSRSRHEKLAAAALTNTGITTFLPVVSEMHSWSDRSKLVDVPLFPGYVFVQIPNSLEAQLTVLKTSGVVQFVGNRYGAVSVTDKEISDVRTDSTSKLYTLTARERWISSIGITSLELESRPTRTPFWAYDAARGNVGAAKCLPARKTTGKGLGIARAAR